MMWRHMRNKLHDKYEAFVTTSEKDELIAKLQEVEDWLYKDGEVVKLEELQKRSRSECREAEAWLQEKQQQQDALSKHADPVLLSGDIKRKEEALDKFCKPIMTKPQPDAPVESMAHEGSQVSPAAAAEPMGTDKSGSSPSV